MIRLACLHRHKHDAWASTALSSILSQRKEQTARIIARFGVLTNWAIILSRYQIKPIKELAAKHLMDETNTLEMAFDGNCIYGGISGFAERGTTIPYTLTNKDKLDQKVGIIDFKSAAYYPEGVLNYDITPHDIRLGPGQTEQSYVLLIDIGRSEDSPATHLVVYEQDGSLTVYKLDCMKK